MDYRSVALGPSRRKAAMTSVAAQHDSSDDVRPGAAGGESGRVEFRVSPGRYRHWRVSYDGPVATLTMDVDERGGLVPGYELKLNSYDLGVDIELYDAVQRLRFEHPEVKAVVMTSGKEKIFCAGANIRMLAASGHSWKVNFCKFTNETRNGIEDATAGTGGLTRVTDKRHVRRDLADYFSTKSEGIGGKKAVAWRLVDEVVPRVRWQGVGSERARDSAASAGRLDGGAAIELTELAKERTDDSVSYEYVSASLDRDRAVAEITVTGPAADAPDSMAGIYAQGAAYWPLAVARELDDLILDLRTNETEIGTWVFKTQGDAARVLAHDELLLANADSDWLAREIVLYWKRTLKRLDVTSRSLIALIEPGSCFAGSLLELALAADRSYMLFGVFEDVDPDAAPAALTVGPANLGPLPMGNGLTRLATRFLGDAEGLAAAEKSAGSPLEAEEAEKLGLVTFAPDDIDWDEEVRIAVEERASFSPDALTGLEANYRFAGPETVETKIFGRLTAWQNWIFYRPNASGPDGALRAYGTGKRADFDRKRV